LRSSPVRGQYVGSGGASVVSELVGSEEADALGAGSSSPPLQPARSRVAAARVATIARGDERWRR
jgi:hypothetical protein